jgi:hypothetical protein
MRRLLVAVLSLVILSSILVVEARSTSPAHEAGLCGPRDLPEEAGQLQGDVPRAHREEDADGLSRAEQGYNCGLALVGHTTLGTGLVDESARNPRGNANMAWAGDCAYVAGSSAPFGPASPDPANGIAVVDVRNPRAPRHVRTLGTTAASSTVLETLHAAELPDGRALLVAGTYGNQSGGDKPMDIYDVSDCADPVLLSTFVWPENIHNLTISGNLRYVYATQPLQVLDIADPTQPVYLGNLENVLPYPLVSTGPFPDLDDNLPKEVREARSGGYTAHEAWPTFDGTKLYLGGQLPAFEAFTIVDITNWLRRVDGAPAGPPEVISQREGRGHSVRTATIGRQRYVMHSEESVFRGAYGCFSEELNPFAGAAQPWLSDISDEANPRMRVSQVQLEINRPENCPAQLDSGVQASVHYHDFDRARNARFAILSMQNAGIRVVDVRDPEAPVEVAYFNPGDVDDGPGVLLDNAWAHSRFVAETNHIWFATASGGFWVVELEPQVKRHFRIRGRTTPVSAAGAPGRVGVDLRVAGPAADTAAAYCTLGAVRV